MAQAKSPVRPSQCTNDDAHGDHQDTCANCTAWRDECKTRFAKVDFAMSFAIDLFGRTRETGYYRCLDDVPPFSYFLAFRLGTPDPWPTATFYSPDRSCLSSRAEFMSRVRLVTDSELSRFDFMVHDLSPASRTRNGNDYRKWLTLDHSQLLWHKWDPVEVLDVAMHYGLQWMRDAAGDTVDICREFDSYKKKQLELVSNALYTPLDDTQEGHERPKKRQKTDKPVKMAKVLAQLVVDFLDTP